jgi:hypothetical protein
MSYKPEELKQTGDSQLELDRCRAMFENIKARCISGEFVSEHEKLFFLNGLTDLYPDVNILEFPGIQYAVVNYLSRTYFEPDRYQSSSNYLKVFRGKMRKVSFNESQKEIEWLKNYISEFIKDIEIKKSSNSAEDEEIEFYKEYRYARKELNTSYEVRFMGSRKRSFETSVIEIGVMYAYLKLLELKEIWEPFPVIRKLKQGDLIITSSRILHVINRHYLEAFKFNSKKSFFREGDIMPINILENIIVVIKLFDSFNFNFELKYLYHERNGIMKNLIINKKSDGFHLGSYFPEYDEAEINRIKTMDNRTIGDITIYSNNFKD